MSETQALEPAPEAEQHHPIPSPTSIKELAARMASTSEETARFFAGPEKNLTLKLVPDED